MMAEFPLKGALEHTSQNDPILNEQRTTVVTSPLRAPRPVVERLTVAVRIRPLKQGEGLRVIHGLSDTTLILTDENSKTGGDPLRQKRGSGERQFIFDNVFGEDATQEAIYAATTRSLVGDVLRGYNATVFAYGATGSGKTHTMVGSTDQPGIMVRALEQLFTAVGHSGKEEEYKVTMSYLEIYNENIRDLLKPESGHLELREDSRGHNIQVANLSEITATSTREVLSLLQRGNRARTVESTGANLTSSRSHALLSVTVSHGTEMGSQLRQRRRHGKLFMIDLAGSERASITKNRGKRLQEGGHINRSLLALGNCINALSGGARFVNFRDSKLTRLLKDALSGNCRTVMVAHISPAAINRDETRNTLVYAARATNISNKVQRNVLDVSYHVTQYRGIISELREEITRLKGKMRQERPRSSTITNPIEIEKHQQLPNDVIEMEIDKDLDMTTTTTQTSGNMEKSPRRREGQAKRLREQMVHTFREQMRLRRRLMELDAQLLALRSDQQRQHEAISRLESRANRLYRPDTSTTPGSTEWGEPLGGPEAEEVDLRHAWHQLSFLEREQERLSELRIKTEQELESCRSKGHSLEEELPERISTDEERELLALVIRVHELEAEKMALHSERLVRQHELARRDWLIQRYDRQRQLCEAIITRQRRLIEEGAVKLPNDLQHLYALYQQELIASSYHDPENPVTPSTGSGDPKLPPIGSTNLISSDPYHRRLHRMGSEISLRTPSSSASSDYGTSPLPPVSGGSTIGNITKDKKENTIPSEVYPPPAVVFPPLAVIKGEANE